MIILSHLSIGNPCLAYLYIILSLLALYVSSARWKVFYHQCFGGL